MLFLTQFQLEEARLTKRDTYLDTEADPRKKRSPIDLDSAAPAKLDTYSAPKVRDNNWLHQNIQFTQYYSLLCYPNSVVLHESVR